MCSCIYKMTTQSDHAPKRSEHAATPLTIRTHNDHAPSSYNQLWFCCCEQDMANPTP